MGAKTDQKQNKTQEEGNTVEDVSTPKMKSAKRKRDSGLDSSLDTSEIYKENVEVVSKKQKKESSSSSPEIKAIESEAAKNSKKDKKKKKTASTLGVVDVDILQQAEVNFQAKIAHYNADCSNEEPDKKKKSSKKTKRVSFTEPAVVTELPPKEKKLKTKGQDLMSEEIDDKNENEQSTKKRKHTEVQITPSEENFEDNENNTEQSSKKKKKKEKKSQTVSPEIVTETNGDGSKQPKKKSKHQDQKAVDVSPENLKKDNESEEPTKKKKKKKEKTPAETPSKEGDDKNKYDRALQYLRLWQSNKKAWKFNKMNQVHLLNIMYDPSLMVDADFQIMVLYLDGLKGKGREKTMADAKEILDNVDTGVDAGKEDRARQLFQMLA